MAGADIIEISFSYEQTELHLPAELRGKIERVHHSHPEGQLRSSRKLLSKGFPAVIKWCLRICPVCLARRVMLDHQIEEAIYSEAI
jgi:hypothetical protein